MTWVWIVATFALVANGLRLRARARALTQVEYSDAAVDPTHRFLVAEGVTLDEAARRRASAHARAQGLDVLDLVPEDLPVERALTTIRLVDPAQYRSDRLAEGRGACQALLVTEDVLARAAVGAPEAGADALAVAQTKGGPVLEGLDPAAMLRAGERLKLYACTSADLAVLPGLVASDPSPTTSFRWWQAMFHEFTFVVFFVNSAQAAFLLAGPFVAGYWGIAALVAHAAQPWLVFLGSRLMPRDLPQQATRSLRVPVSILRMALAYEEDRAQVSPVEAARPVYDELLAAGMERFFEARRDDCPLCASKSLELHFETTDLLQHKPGRFRLEACADCGHIFQNPRLSLEGLDFYYRDFYDGLGDGTTGSVFRAQRDHYIARAQMVAEAGSPSTWLDVGTGHGHFCCMARDVLPEVRFDGLDIGDGIEEAERRRWVDRAYRGLFPERAGDLAEQYDVVSMSHYLEHTREPREELAAANTALADGGHLLIEVPDPDSSIGRAIGRRWLPWFQPQHQHFLSLDNLTGELGREGFEVVKVHRSECHQAVDFSFAALAWLEVLGPPGRRPWLPLAGLRGRQVRRAVVFALGWPLLVLAQICDQIVFGLVRAGLAPSNTYRVLARKCAGAAAAESPAAGGGA